MTTLAGLATGPIAVGEALHGPAGKSRQLQKLGDTAELPGLIAQDVFVTEGEHPRIIRPVPQALKMSGTKLELCRQPGLQRHIGQPGCKRHPCG